MYEWKVMAADGSEKEVIFHKASFLDADGKVGGLIGVILDITARKQAEKALQESEQRFRQVVESSPLPIGLAAADGMIGYVNPKFVETFKYTLEDVPRLADWYRLAYPDPAYRQGVIAQWQKAREKITHEGGTSEKIEAEITCKDGSKRIMEIFEAQMGAQTLALFNDLTERKRMEEAMEKRLVALSRPLGDAADIDFHDLFNLEDIQEIQDLFAKSTGVSSLITTPDGAPITQPSNFCRLCSSFIRQTEPGRQKCAISDAALGRYNPDAPTIHHCLSAGLCAAGASITVGGKHIANWLIGQVRDETVNEENIREYARALGVDAEEFIATFREVPYMPAEQFQQVAQALFVFANQLSAMAYQNVQQARFITERRQAEAQLLATQERLELALQGADLGTWDWNVKTGAVTFNKRYAEMLGYTLEEVEPHLHFWEKLVHPDELPAVVEILNAHLEGQTPFYETEHRLRHKLGSWVWVLAKGKVIGRDAQGKAVRACGTHLDITERKRAEVALRDSEERLRLALQAANQGLYDLNIQTGEAKVSPEYATMLGYDPGEFQETNARWIERLHADDREQVAATYQAYVRGDIPNYEVEFRQRTQSGDWKWILSLGKVVAWDEDGKPLRMLGTHTDITERKQAEAALRESEKRLREAQEMAHLGFWYWNVKTGDVTWSDEVYRIFQLDPKEFTPHIDSILELSPWPGDHERDQELIRKAMESHEKGTYEQRFLLPDKSIGYYYSTFQGKYDDGGNLIFIVGTVLDITARKRAEEERARLEDQMREVQKLESLGVLAGGIAHDFNNLLMAILGNADLALLSLSPASPAHPKLEQIVRASQRAADLCGQMLAYSGKGRFVVGRYDLPEIVQEMAQILKVSVSKKVALRYFFAADLPAVEVDATQMRQVIMNLITNASEALGDQSGFISVSTGVMDCDRAYLAESYLDDKLPEGKYVYLEVADTGSGIDEETRRRIFDPFFTTKFTGRGLGLAAVLGIVRGHQGAIKVYSEVGQGTTFKILLPAREWAPGDRGPSAAQSVPPLSRGGTILLVDDDPEVRDVGSQMLERLGFKVLTAAHGREGLKVFQEYGGGIDCVILDLTMPEMGGEEVFRELRRLRSNVRVILSSGYNEQEVTQRFAGKGLAGFIQKPYRVANLQEVLNRILG
jgi:PAS domain S-box-containing protein